VLDQQGMMVLTFCINHYSSGPTLRAFPDFSLLSTTFFSRKHDSSLFVDVQGGSEGGTRSCGIQPNEALKVTFFSLQEAVMQLRIEVVMVNMVVLVDLIAQNLQVLDHNVLVRSKGDSEKNCAFGPKMVRSVPIWTILGSVPGWRMFAPKKIVRPVPM